MLLGVDPFAGRAETLSDREGRIGQAKRAAPLATDVVATAASEQDYRSASELGGVVAAMTDFAVAMETLVSAPDWSGDTEARRILSLATAYNALLAELERLAAVASPGPYRRLIERLHGELLGVMRSPAGIRGIMGPAGETVELGLRIVSGRLRFGRGPGDATDLDPHLAARFQWIAWRLLTFANPAWARSGCPKFRSFGL